MSAPILILHQQRQSLLAILYYRACRDDMFLDVLCDSYRGANFVAGKVNGGCRTVFFVLCTMQSWAHLSSWRWSWASLNLDLYLWETSPRSHLSTVLLSLRGCWCYCCQSEHCHLHGSDPKLCLPHPIKSLGLPPLIPHSPLLLNMPFAFECTVLPQCELGQHYSTSPPFLFSSPLFMYCSLLISGHLFFSLVIHSYSMSCCCCMLDVILIGSVGCGVGCGVGCSHYQIKSNAFIKPFLHQLISQCAVLKPSLKPPKQPSNAGVEAHM